ncbi:MAG TPA: hypothetical protein VGL93_20405 [Streptosporangiaceae bacterium]|jgi:hypothetical protein
MEFAAVVISVVAVTTSALLGWRALIIARHSNSVPVLIELFGEHRNKRLAEAREFVYHDLSKYDLSVGLDALPVEKQVLIRDLAWFYDNLGALVTHGVVDIEPVSGYLGGSVLGVWEKMLPLVTAEREKRGGSYDVQRWQVYFENLYHLVRQCPPAKARSAQHLWRLQH